MTEKNIHKYLGREKYTYQMANPDPEIGIVRGLAWTSVGGDTPVSYTHLDVYKRQPALYRLVRSTYGRFAGNLFK